MRIRRIEVENFKSFDNIKIDMQDFNIIIGANAAGKSNFISIFRFINDAIEHGIDDAISLQGGIKYLYNSTLGNSQDIKIKIFADIETNDGNRLDRHYIFRREKIEINSYEYCINITPNKRGEGYKIRQEYLRLFCKKESSEEKTDFASKNNDVEKEYDDITLEYKKEAKKRVSFTSSLEIDERSKSSFEQYINIFSRNNDINLMIFMNLFSHKFQLHGSNFKFYNFNTNLLKSPSSIVTKSELEEDGSNLVNIIQKLIKDKKSKVKLTNLIKTVLPFVEEIKTENSINKSLIFKIREKYSKNDYPSHLLSDGTVNVLAIIVALYFQRDNDIIIIEEPERNIHPQLLNNIVQLLKDISKNKQIIITTHNPYILRESKLSDLFLIMRDDKGFSIIQKPENSEKVKIFLANDLGIEDLFVEGLLYE